MNHFWSDYSGETRRSAASLSPDFWGKLGGLAAFLALGVLLVSNAPLNQIDIAEPGFLALHSLMEMFAVVVAAMIFAVGWSTFSRQIERNMVLLGCAFLAVALLDMAHLLSYNGMPDFVTPSDRGKAIAFWLAGRLIAVLALLLLVIRPDFILKTHQKRSGALIAALSVTALVYWVVLFHFDWLPVFFVPGVGLTTVKVATEYTLMALLLGAGLWLARQMQRGELPFDGRFVLAAIVTMFFSELCFTLYTTVTDMPNLLGHIYKVISSLFLYRAVFVDSVRAPLKLAQDNEARFRQLMESAPDGILILGEDGIIAAANEMTEQIFHYRRTELIGQPIELLLPESARADHIAKRDAYIAHAQTRRMGAQTELTGLTSFGNEVSVDVSLSPLKTDGGAWIMCVVRDISARKVVEEQLRRQGQELRAIADNTPDIISRFDRQLRRVYVNQAITRVDGRPREFYLNKTFRELGKSDEFTGIWERHLEAVFTTGQEAEFEFHYDSVNGRRYYMARLVPELKPDGVVEHVIAIAPEITDRIHAEAESKRLASILEVAPALVCITSPQHRMVYLNPAGYEMLGVDRAVAVSGKMNMLHFLPHWAVRRWLEEAIPEAESKGFWRGENAIMRLDGTELPVMQTVIAHRDEQGELLHFSNIIQDFSERKRLEDQLSHQATHDVLTGLPNRVLLLDRLRQGTIHAARNGRSLAVLFLDLDHFKNINDTLGHFVGDELLRQVAARLKSVLRRGDTLGRLGGDEFAVVLEDINSKEDVLLLADKLLAQFSVPFMLHDRLLYIGSSVGLTIFPEDNQLPDDLLRHADIAMYAAKKRGRGTYCVYTPDMNADMQRRMEILESLRSAVLNEEFILHYQPKIDLATGKMCGMEALVRWIHPEKGMIPPDTFIPLAEESGLILPLGQWVLKTACAQNKAWQDAGLSPLRVAVNLSARQFGEEGLAEKVADTLAETGLNPSFLELEITESMLMENAEESLRTLYQIRDQGVVLSIDDFGTGYSSLGYLRQFPVDYVKIDRSFVMEAPFNANDAAIASAIISMAHNLGLKVVAEGVETAQHVEFLRRFLCDEMQGYFFSRPLPTEAFTELLENGRCLELGANAVLHG
ncbi:MAG: EAL domain-containing protein [Nitrosomonadales bacterium]|nr:EAL domain-containing protein [Nitrosomonadales bacterium]